jgi:hypothetical protein
MDGAETILWRAPSAEERRKKKEFEEFCANPAAAKARETAKRRAREAEITARWQAAEAQAQAEARAHELAVLNASASRPRENDAGLLDRQRDLEDKQRSDRREIAELRGLVNRLAEENAELKERIKQPAPMPIARQTAPIARPDQRSGRMRSPL